MKSYTDLEQSKKLAEILPTESADMYYPWDIDSKSFLNIPIVKDDSYYVQCSIDCWSLAPLLGVLPKNLDIGRPILATNYRGYYWVSYFDEYMRENKFTSKIYNNPIDACYEMILKLHEQKLL